MKKIEIPVIDLFAGPGGLSHGFAEYRNPQLSFRIRLSIEKDAVAYQTLLLRTFLRQFDKPPEDYYRYIRKEITDRTFLQNRYPQEWRAAVREAKMWTLGEKPFDEVYSAISNALGGSRQWVLLGGPPCQAYSLAGRSRMKNMKNFSTDHRHTLYREYLKIVATQQPAVFVMENVKGILSSKHGATGKSQSIIHQILSDLRDPAQAVASERDVVNYLPHRAHGYVIYSFVKRTLLPETLLPSDFVVRSETWGVPQNRHRVLLLGIRRDIDIEPHVLAELFRENLIKIEDVLQKLPTIRSRISKADDCPTQWVGIIRRLGHSKEFAEIRDPDVRSLVRTYLRRIRPIRSTGNSFTPGTFKPKKLTKWLWDRRLEGVIQHEARSHMPDDLLRYFFASCAAKARQESPKLRDFPKHLLPKHSNLKSVKVGGKSTPKIDFEDRFRVQVAGKSSSTITSHISKDGNYFIHYDPLQCRSLTVREAARLQTFPDSYFFEGGTTQQYHQVGNAVPPLLAIKLAGVVGELLVGWLGSDIRRRAVRRIS